MDSAQDYRIAFFTNTYLPFVGGVALSVDLYRRHLNDLGDDVRIYAPQYDGPLEREPHVCRLPAITKINKTDFSLPLSLSFKPITDFFSEDYDVVHVHHPFLLGEMGMRQARQFRLPLVLTYHTQYEQYAHYLPLDLDQTSRALVSHTKDFANHCDLVIAPTSDVARLLEKRGVHSPIEVLPTGVELDLYREMDREAARHAWNLGEEEALLLHVGRLAEEKNLPFLMEAMLRCLAANPQARLILAGSGGAEAELRDMAAAHEAGERVEFVGALKKERLRQVYRAADVFVFSSQSETQGMVLVEAMAGGAPVVALDADAVRDTVQDGENGRLLPSGTDPEAMAEAASALLADEALRKRLAEGAAKTAEEYDMPRLAQRLHDCYAGLKQMPRHRLRKSLPSFNLVRSYFDTVADDLGEWFNRL